MIGRRKTLLILMFVGVLFLVCSIIFGLTMVSSNKMSLPAPTRPLLSITSVPSSINTDTPMPPSMSLDLTPTSVPYVVSAEQPPLPHNGLFIRRNNEFGTRLTEGIKELIAQGQIPDPTEIRYDDFVNSDQIPSSLPGQSVAISYGVSEIPLTNKRDNRATHYLEIVLRSSDAGPVTNLPDKELIINYVFVVDTSGSMEGEKLDNAKVSIRELMSKMRGDDILAVIGFNENPYEVIQAKSVNQIDENDINKLISLNANGDTNINDGLSFGINQIKLGLKRIELVTGRTDNVINQVYLFSDGNPTTGETDWIRIRHNIDKKVRDEGIRLSTFAFGLDANKNELDLLAGVTGGSSTLVTDITALDDIQLNLDSELNRRDHLAAINVQMKIEIDQDIDIIYLYGHDQIQDPARIEAVFREVQAAEKEGQQLGVESPPSLVTETEGIRIFVPNLAINETYWVVFELNIPEEKPSIGKMTVQFADTINHKPVISKSPLTLGGELPPQLVVQHALGLWTSEVLFWALDDLHQGRTDIAMTRIENHIKVLEDAGIELSSDQLLGDASTLRNFSSLAESVGLPRFITAESGTWAINYLGVLGQARDGYDRRDYAAKP